MNKYINIIIVLTLIVLGFWLFLSNKNNKETIINSNNQSVKTMKATLHTNQGDIVIEFFDKQTPNTVANFIKLAKEGFYNGVKFHRVIKGFMIQGGDPLSKDDLKINLWGTGGPGYSFADELGKGNEKNSNDIGTIAMANSGKDTNGSQFFINTAANNFLDTKHVVFGKVISGMDVVKKIENTPTTGSPYDRPIAPMIIKSVSVE
jgi:cyclophilin family peptidyl-prolyl cis-trans isomerase